MACLWKCIYIPFIPFYYYYYYLFIYLLLLLLLLLFILFYFSFFTPSAYIIQYINRFFFNLIHFNLSLFIFKLQCNYFNFMIFISWFCVQYLWWIKGYDVILIFISKISFITPIVIFLYIFFILFSFLFFFFFIL